MFIKPEIDVKYREPEIHVCHHTEDESVRKILKELHTMYDVSLAAVDERGNRRILNISEIYSFYAEGQKVFALGAKQRYAVPKKLYELEQEFAEANFVRISKSEIVNYRLIKSLDMSVTGTIKVVMKNGYETYTSRRNVAKIKELLLREKKYE